MAEATVGLQAIRSASRQTGAGAATLAGWALGVVFFLVGKARAPTRKALHPAGEVYQGLLRRSGCSWRTGVSWLDEPGNEQVLLRFSRATGLPKCLPGVLGLAMRVPLDGGGHGDVLLATTGSGGLGRFALRLARRRGAVYGCLIPYQAPTGPVMLAALPLDHDGAHFDLVCSSLGGAWSSFGRLKVLSPSDRGQDAPVSFDPVLNVIPGLTSFNWAAQLRRFPDAASRRARGAVAR